MIEATSTQPCGCDPGHKPAPWPCADYPLCAYGRAVQKETAPMLTQMLEALVAQHGEEIVGKALHVVKEHLVSGSALPSPEDASNPAHANLGEAWRLTHGNRKSSYGDVVVAFARYAKIWTGLLGAKLTQDLTASDVALLMTGLKLAREFNKQQSDNVVDAHGYLILHDEIKAAQ